MTAVRALLADDEPRLARALARQLETAWPGLEVVAQPTDGDTAVAQALALRPELLFLDVQMPGRSGLDVAAAVADDWPDGHPLPLVVFVTAFDRFAVAAFERDAVDYLLKPVTPERLAQTVARLQARRGAAGPRAAGDAAALVQRSAPPPIAPDETAPLAALRVADGDRVRMVPAAEVLVLEAADKYVRVVTAGFTGEVRLSLRELSQRLVGVPLQQVHRATLVNAAAIESAQRDEAGHYWLQVRGLPRPVKVSRAFGHQFKPM